MNGASNDRAAAFAATFTALYASHAVIDHWAQSDHEAATKGKRGREGRRACASHSLKHAAGSAAALGLASRATGLRPSLPHAAAGIALSAASHYWADRRFTLEHLAALAGQRNLYRLGAPRPDRDDNPTLGTGAYAMDQAFHVCMLFFSALVVAQ